MAVDLLAIILTRDESANISFAIDSARSITDDVLVFDSYSTDNTPELARARGARVVQHQFVNYSAQRDAALDTAAQWAPKWIFFLDADERVSDELRASITRVVHSTSPDDGYLVGIRLFWRGTWVRRGAPPTYLLRLVRYGRARYDQRVVNEYLTVDGSVGRLDGYLIHEDRKPFDRWCARHVRYAALEAEAFFQRERARLTEATTTDANLQKRIRRQAWYDRLPLRVRPFLLFAYTLTIGGGLLDGPAAWHYHYWQKLWYRLLIDEMIIERRRASRHGR